MKPRQLLLAAFLTGIAASSSVRATTIIYQDIFSGDSTTNLNGQPTTPPYSGTWSAETTWKANGSIAAGANATSSDDNAFLPFTPTTGKVYTLSADINVLNTGVDWIGLGFAQTANTTTNFATVDVNAAAWMLLREDPQIVVFPGPNTATPFGAVATTDGVRTLKVVLDTTAANWTVTYYDNGSPITWTGNDSNVYTTYIYSTNPIINYVGFGRYHTAAGTVDNFTLTVIPEPRAALLGGLGLLVLLRRRR